MDEKVKVIATAVLVLSQLYILEPWRFPAFARFWDFIARWTGYAANVLGWVSVNARLYYYQSVREMGGAG
jgi:hypothetical protein